VREQLQEISATAVQSLKEVREIISNLRPHQLETVGLMRTLTFMCEQAAGAAGLRLHTEIAPLDGVFAPEDEVIFYRLVQEGLNNIIKHAQADRATIRVERRAGGALHLTIEDDGRGFDPAATRAQMGRSRGGFGLKGLAERTRQLGGTFHLQSAPGRGTKIQITIQERAHEQ
jgi:signal transduction histidine kinase